MALQSEHQGTSRQESAQTIQLLLCCCTRKIHHLHPTSDLSTGDQKQSLLNVHLLFAFCRVFHHVLCFLSSGVRLVVTETDQLSSCKRHMDRESAHPVRSIKKSIHVTDHIQTVSWHTDVCMRSCSLIDSTFR